jgi:hypothetical protein
MKHIVHTVQKIPRIIKHELPQQPLQKSLTLSSSPLHWSLKTWKTFRPLLDILGIVEVQMSGFLWVYSLNHILSLTSYHHIIQIDYTFWKSRDLVSFLPKNSPPLHSFTYMIYIPPNLVPSFLHNLPTNPLMEPWFHSSWKVFIDQLRLRSIIETNSPGSLHNNLQNNKTNQKTNSSAPLNHRATSSSAIELN